MGYACDLWSIYAVTLIKGYIMRKSDLEAIQGGLRRYTAGAERRSLMQKRDAERKEEKMRREMLDKEAREHREKMYKRHETGEATRKIERQEDIDRTKARQEVMDERHEEGLTLAEKVRKQKKKSERRKTRRETKKSKRDYDLKVRELENLIKQQSRGSETTQTGYDKYGDPYKTTTTKKPIYPPNEQAIGGTESLPIANSLSNVNYSPPVTLTPEQAVGAKRWLDTNLEDTPQRRAIQAAYDATLSQQAIIRPAMTKEKLMGLGNMGRAAERLTGYGTHPYMPLGQY